MNMEWLEQRTKKLKKQLEDEDGKEAELMHEMPPANGLLGLIDAALFADGATDVWQGRTTELEAELHARGYRSQCQRMGAIGNILGKMLTGIAENTARMRATARGGSGYYYLYPRQTNE